MFNTPIQDHCTTSRDGFEKSDTQGFDYSRPPVPPIDRKREPIIFQTIDIDYYLGNNRAGVMTKYSEFGPIVRLYGVTSNGNTVLAHLYGFRPYFYVECPAQFDEKYPEKLKNVLNKSLMEGPKKENDVKNAVISIEIQNKYNIYGFQFNQRKPFFKITVSTPAFLAHARTLLENGIRDPESGTLFHFQTTYENNINFEIRFMVDVDMSGCNWISLPPSTYNIREGKNEKESNCQIELDAAWEAVHSIPSEGEWDRIAPYRILSYDIECAGRKDCFVDPEHDPVIQIANTIMIYGMHESYIKVIFTLGSCEPIIGAKVISLETEKELLKAWANFILAVDPDIITGYNIFNFDTPYLIERAIKLKVNELLYMGRIKNDCSRIRISKFENRAFGKRENKQVNILGRLQLDVLQILIREHKLRSYSLNNVSFHFLGEQKEDVHHSMITDLQNGDEHTRRRLAIYCIKDSYLPIRLIEKLMILTNYIEMSRVTGVPINYLLTRGQQVKVVSQLLRSCKKEDGVIPCLNSSSGDEYEGATVIKPSKGYYNIPIATLDFVSLYPSIMISHNLCYTTLLTSSQAKAMKEEDYVVTPCGYYFVKQHVKKGILPSILQNLLDTRKHVKELLKSEKDPMTRKVLDGRQLAIKLSANSVYGFTGAQVGKLPCVEISSSVTAFGRKMIEDTKNLVEERYCTDNKYNYDAKVIYGDTDSVMIKFGTTSMVETMELAREAASFVSSQFANPIKLEFEKVYHPYLLISKKRYAGLLYTKPEKYDKIDCKGIETVRRDNCLLVANLISSCLYKILIECDPQEAVKHACQTISDLLRNEVDISLLVISKELRKSGEAYTAKQPHAELAERMRKRDIGSAPKLGDRVPFVYIMGSKGDRAYEKAEDPIYVLDNNIPIDTNYYLMNQLAKPLVRLFEPILGEKTSDFLLKGEHTLHKAVLTSSVGLLTKFTKKTLSCLGCKAAIDENSPFQLASKALCTHCIPDCTHFYLKELKQLSTYQKRCNSLWTECQRCQGGFVEEVICSNRDCPIFYMRTKVIKDLKIQEQIIKRFNYITD